MKSIIAAGILLGWHTVPLLLVPTQTLKPTPVDRDFEAWWKCTKVMKVLLVKG